MRSVQAEQEGQKVPSDVSAAEERRPEARAKTGAIVVCVCRFYAPTQGGACGWAQVAQAEFKHFCLGERRRRRRWRPIRIMCQPADM